MASEMLEKIEDWNTYMNISTSLYRKDPIRLQRHLMLALGKYLKNHFGTVAMETVHERIRGIISVTDFRYANELLSLMKKEHPDRLWQ